MFFHAKTGLESLEESRLDSPCHWQMIRIPTLDLSNLTTEHQKLAFVR